MTPPSADVVVAYEVAGEPVDLGGAWQVGPLVFKPVESLPETLWRAEVLDWATLGAAPVGADLAALALSTFVDPVEDYLAGAGGRFQRADVELGYRATLALTGAGRVHWMLSRGMRLPDGYEDFILSRAP
ncbi:hypothetical protein [Nonomuraea sp. B19D2]|uniref:hypothetical protein n=1 Tax=Nonomuraea sp. B19D2 TaxID=3159561 RepID=UPI0032DA5D93